MQLQPGTYLQGDKYRIIRALGSGGFGITYLAEHELAERKVCIKEFFPKEFFNRNEDSRSISLGSQGSAKIMDAYKAKFIKEAKTIARLKHPNIIHIHDVFEENNTAYYVMEYIEGESLSDLVKRSGALVEAEAVRYIRSVAEALGYIHERKIMHLDVKPANVMLNSEDDQVVVIDFGLSKQYDEEGHQTSSTPVGISAGFAPMEQYQQGGVKEFSPETDIYSLGATLYYLVTGQVPPQAVCVADEGLPELPAHLSSGVRNAIERSMTFQRKHRPHSAKEFLALLEDNTPEVVAIPTPKPTPSPVSAPVSAPVDDKTSVAASAPVADERTVVGAPAPKAQPTPQSKNEPKPKRSKRGLWIMLSAFVVAAVASFVLLGGGSSEKEKIAQQQLPPNNEIWYTSSDGKVVNPYIAVEDVFGAEIESNTYKDGKGIIKFNGDVTTIGEDAFGYCKSLKSVTIPNSVTTIGAEAFLGCDYLKSVTIPNNVTTIGEAAFYECKSLTSVTIPNSVTTIGGEAFRYCDNLTSVTIPNSVTTIGCGAFSNCLSLISVTILDNVTTIGEYAFCGCSSLKEFKSKFASPDGRCLIIDGKLVTFAPAGISEYTIPNSVTTIGEYAFNKCESLTSVTIPNSVTTIGGCAFQDCSNLTSVTIPNSVKTIGEDAFAFCSNLKSVTIPNSVTMIGEYAFCGCSSLKEFKSKLASEDGRCLIVNGKLVAFAPAGISEYTIPNSVTTIGEGAFYECKSLTSITIPNSVTTIGECTFSKCESLTGVTIPNSVTTIGGDAFAYCSNLTSVTIPNSVTTIGYGAFEYCKSLKSVTIPNSVTEIGNFAFSFCGSLNSITIPNSVTTIGEYAFCECDSLTSVTIPNSVTTIGDEAFAYCDNLSEETKNKIKSINPEAF